MSMMYCSYSSADVRGLCDFYYSGWVGTCIHYQNVLCTALDALSLMGSCNHRLGSEKVAAQPAVD